MENIQLERLIGAITHALTDTILETTRCPGASPNEFLPLFMSNLMKRILRCASEGPRQPAEGPSIPWPLQGFHEAWTSHVAEALHNGAQAEPPSAEVGQAEAVWAPSPPDNVPLGLD